MRSVARLKIKCEHKLLISTKYHNQLKWHTPHTYISSSIDKKRPQIDYLDLTQTTEFKKLKMRIERMVGLIFVRLKKKLYVLHEMFNIPCV